MKILNKKIAINTITAIVLSSNLYSGDFQLDSNSLTGVKDGSVAIADLNGDSKNDILMTGNDGTNKVSEIYLNNGSGNFTKDTTNSSVLTGVYYSSVAIADLNGDSKNDILLTGDDGSNKISEIYLNDGSGNFTKDTTNSNVLTGVKDGSASIADLNGDSKNDILITGSDGTNKVSEIYLNDGSGNFTKDTTNSNVLVDGSGSASIADLNGDTHNDIVIAANDGTNRVSEIYLNDGSGNFTKDTTNSNVLVEGSGTASIADLNGDTHNDILLLADDGVSSTPIVKIYLNDGSGNFSLDTTNSNALTLISFASVAIVDLNGDSKNDILISGMNSNNGQAISEIYLNDGSGNFTKDTTNSSTIVQVQNASVAVGDLNGDSKNDILITGRDSTFNSTSKIYIDNATYTPTAPTDVNLSTTSKTTMTLTWSDSATNETGYKVYKSTDGTTYELNASLSANTITKDITGLSADTKYYFIVSPYNGDGEANATAENNTTLANAPTLTVTDINSTKITLNWNDSSNTETSYKIYSSMTSGSGYELNSTETAGVITKDMTGLSENTTYYFKVAVVNEGGEANSSEESNTTNSKPTFTAFTNKTLNEDFGTNTTLTISDLTDSNSQDINLSVESNDTSILSFTKSWGDSNLAFANYNGQTLTLTLNSEVNKSGVVELNVSAYDGFDYVNNIFNVTVNPVDDNPTITTISNLSKDMNFSEFNLSINLDDADFGDLNLTVDVNDTSLVEFNQTWYDSVNEYNLTYSEYHSKDINLTIKSKPNVAGVVRFTITAEDNQSGKVNSTFDLNISTYSFVLADLNAISLTSTTTTNLTLPTVGTTNSSAISWSSNYSSIISSSGIVTQPTSDTVVTLTANLILANTTLSKEFNVTVTGKPTVVVNSSSSSSAESFSTTVVKADDTTTNTENLQIEIDSNIEKDVIDTTTTKTVQTKETTLTDGTISKTTVEIPKDKITNLKASVEVTNNNLIEQTTLEAEDGVKVSISNDRSITSKVSTNTIEAEVKVNSNAEATTKIIVQKKVEVTMKSPKGSEIKQENSGKVISNIALKANTQNGINPVEIEMSAEVSGNLVTVAKVTNQNREVTTYRLELPNNIISGNMELVQNESDENIYNAIKSTFKTSENFILNRDSRRVIVEGNSIQIVGTTAWQKFEEKQYFDGRRTISLLLGGAKIIRDGKEEVMLQNEEYEFIPTDSTNTSSIDTLTTIYSNSYLNIQYGWNLITTPVDRELNIASNFKYATESYKNNGEWIKNPETIKQNEGLWVKYSEHISEKISGDSYEPTYNNLNSGWNLLGAGRDIKFYELSSFSEVWVYDSKVKSWIKNPTTIKRGYGFWVKN